MQHATTKHRTLWCIFREAACNAKGLWHRLSCTDDWVGLSMKTRTAAANRGQAQAIQSIGCCSTTAHLQSSSQDARQIKDPVPCGTRHF